MNEDEFHKRLDKLYAKERRDYNTIEYAKEWASLLPHLGEAQDNNWLAYLGCLEESWALLSPYYSVDGEIENPRSLEQNTSPLEAFLHTHEFGFYPPPEIMLSILMCFEYYLREEGKISLDEAFFGKPHKKRTSPAFKTMGGGIYVSFDSFVDNENYKRKESDLPKASLELLAEQYLYGEGAEPEIDIDSFLRGYRRWKKLPRRIETLSELAYKGSRTKS